ncbi:hypothetical protein RB195_020100 [Necator americanus]|uniref:Uncharacterized protein n=1 Tax=Necator americanus TaxID=51031 RepID=A0ABR1CH81_NECAM
MLCFSSSFALFVAIIATHLVNRTSQRISDEVRYRASSKMWSTSAERKSKVVDGSSRNRGSDENPHKKVWEMIVSGSTKTTSQISIGTSSSESDELNEDNLRNRTVLDRSLIFPMRQPNVGGIIAFPPPLPTIYGHDRSLPFGTAFVKSKKKFRRMFRGSVRGLS